MAAGSNVIDTPPARPTPMPVDQAVFTSVRSHMAGGYRLIAVSPGLLADERAEILRRAPSHGSLARIEPDAVGMLSFPLPTGRTCVGHVEYAGLEPSGRGGGRVYTHFILLDETQTRAFNRNPIGVWRAMRMALPAERVLVPQTAMRRLSLDAPNPAEPCDPFAGWPLSWFRMLVQLHAAVTSGQAVQFQGDDDGCRIINGLCTLLAATVREGVAISLGLRYSSLRRIQVTGVPSSPSDAAADRAGAAPIRFCVPSREQTSSQTPVKASIQTHPRSSSAVPGHRRWPAR